MPYPRLKINPLGIHKEAKEIHRLCGKGDTRNFFNAPKREAILSQAVLKNISTLPIIFVKPSKFLKGLGHKIRIALKWYGLIGLR
jgi:hypothetical protein